MRKISDASMLAVLVLLSGIVGLSWSAMAISQTVSIHIDHRPPFFSPHTISAVVGVVVRWENRTREVHTILADDCLRRSKCSFESPMIEPGGTFQVPNLPAGDYAYHCGIHPFMRGVLVVKGKRLQIDSTDI